MFHLHILAHFIDLMIKVRVILEKDSGLLSLIPRLSHTDTLDPKYELKFVCV